MKVLTFEDKTSKISFPFQGITITKIRKENPGIPEDQLFKKLVESVVRNRWERTDKFYWKTPTSGHVTGKSGYFKSGLMKVYIENTRDRPKTSRSRDYQQHKA